MTKFRTYLLLTFLAAPLTVAFTTTRAQTNESTNQDLNNVRPSQEKNPTANTLVTESTASNFSAVAERRNRAIVAGVTALRPSNSIPSELAN